ncbi:MAG: hypothetical protein AAF431_14495 [Pseudomonadota bacterium]
MPDTLTQNRGLTTVQILALVLIVLAARLMLIDAYGTITPYWDDWGVGWIIAQYAGESFAFSDLLGTNNGHRYFYSKILNIVLFHLNSAQWDVQVVQVANAVLAAAIAGVLLIIVRRSQGELSVLTATVFVLLFWAFPISLVSILWAMQTHTYIMILLVVVGLWGALAKPYSGSWWAAVICLFAASQSLSGGALAAVTVFATMVWLCIFDRSTRALARPTLIASGVASVTGLAHIVYYADASTPVRPENLYQAWTSFSKTMSWPLSTETWPMWFINLPCVLLLLSYFTHPRKISRISSFTVALFVFGVATAVAVALARGLDGDGPARRYTEFLSLAVLANVFALCLLYRLESGVWQWLKNFVTFAWVLTFVASFGYQAEIIRFTLEDRERLNTSQFFSVRNYLVTKQPEHLHDKAHREVPFPNGRRLQTILDETSSKNMLHYQLQVPEEPTGLGLQNAFVLNGTFAPKRASFVLTYNGEAVLGSYNREAGRNEATGKYVSEPFMLDRPYMMIPVTGFLGFEGLNLRIREIGSGNITPIQPRSVNAAQAGNWRPIWIKTPKEPFQLVAEDQSDTRWFGFGQPRTAGSLTYFTLWLLRKSDDLMKLGALLLLLGLYSRLPWLFGSHRD